MGGTRVAIIGGYGGMGRIFANLFKDEGCDVVITGPTESKGVAAAEELKVEYAKDNKKAASESDVVVITVPLEVTAKTIKEVAPHVRESGFLLDLTSVKEEPCKLMAEHAKTGVEVCGTHPIFGPRVGKIDGQVFVLTPVRGSKWLAWLKDILVKHRARVYESTPKEHDEIMAVVQGLTHFAYISLGKTLEELDFDIKKSRNFSSPIYELMLDMVGRIIGQDPHLYAEIQMQNPKVPSVHEKFIETAKKLSQTVKNKDEAGFVSAMAAAAKHFDDVDRAMGRSDKAISSLVSELENLEKSIGKEICLQHIYSGKKHLGVVKDVKPDDVVLSEGGKEFSLKLSNVRVLGWRDRLAFKREKYGEVSRDYSAVFSEGVSEEFMAKLLTEHDENIAGVSVKDVFRGPKVGDGKKSVCFGVSMINANLKDRDTAVREFIQKIGGVLR